MLHLRKLRLSNFATHKSTTLDLPETGLIAITGSNGAGKSSLLECVAAALWGETLRGEPGWREGEQSAVQVATDGVKVTRKRIKASTKLEWADLSVEGEPTNYETNSKAQTALEALIGSYDVWRRTCVLSSLDSAAFSLARDSDRKRLLEEFLGLAMFDAALDACRKDRREAASRAQKAEAESAELNLRFSFVQSQLEQARKELEALLAETGGKDAASLKSEGLELARKADKLKQQVEQAAVKVRNLERAGIEEEARVQVEVARLGKLGKDACPTCGQSVTDLKAHLEAEIAAAKKAATAKKGLLSASLERAKNEWATLAEQQEQANSRLNKARENYRLAESQGRMRQGAQDKIAKAEADLLEWQERIKAHAGAVEKTAKEAAHLEATEQVLGLRGVRAQVLDHALGALEANANGWLTQMPTEQGMLTVTLSGSTTQKSGNVVDAISLKVRGRPYASCSGGERRRVDVALLLALRELAVAAHGRDGSLLCDEVFDALDAQGQADVASALTEMSQDRLVVVVTHSPEMVKAMRPSLHVHVSLEDGFAKLSER